jgi:probable HAF family extracellular repeat protein
MNFRKLGIFAVLLAVTASLAIAIPAQLAAKEEHQDKRKHTTHYSVTDLGTLGGPDSGFVLGTQVLNDRGTTVGGADTASLDLSYPNVNPLLGFPGNGTRPFIQHGFKWHEGVLTDLGALPGNNNSYANWVNASGAAVGESENGSIDPLTGFPEVAAVVWKDGRMINLGRLGGYESEALAVNDKAQVVGFATNAIPDSLLFPFAFIAETLGTQTRAVLWDKGVIRDLGTLGGPDAAAFSLNNRGQVLGYSYTNSTINPATGLPMIHAFLWEDGKMIDLGTLGGTLVNPSFINDRGQVVGSSNLAEDQEAHPFLWDRGKLTDLGTLGGNFAGAGWINDNGEIIGGSTPPGDNAFLGFFWKNGVMTNIGTVDGDLCSFPRYINSRGQVVGLSNDCQGNVSHAFLWQDGGPAVDLNTRIAPNSGIQLADAININDRGEIVGLGTLATGDLHAVLLKPCDDDHSSKEGCDYNPVDSSVAPKRTAAKPTKVDPAILSRFGHRIHIPARKEGI